MASSMKIRCQIIEERTHDFGINNYFLSTRHDLEHRHIHFEYNIFFHIRNEFRSLENIVHQVYREKKNI